MTRIHRGIKIESDSDALDIDEDILELRAQFLENYKKICLQMSENSASKTPELWKAYAQMTIAFHQMFPV